MLDQEGAFQASYVCCVIFYGFKSIYKSHIDKASKGACN